MRFKGLLHSRRRLVPQLSLMLWTDFAKMMVDYQATIMREIGLDAEEQLIVSALIVAAQSGPGGVRSMTRGRLRNAGFISAISVADATAIPRETVRRRLNKLADKGFALHQKGKGWTVNPSNRDLWLRWNDVSVDKIGRFAHRVGLMLEDGLRDDVSPEPEPRSPASR